MPYKVLAKCSPARAGVNDPKAEAANVALRQSKKLASVTDFSKTCQRRASSKKFRSIKSMFRSKKSAPLLPEIPDATESKEFESLSFTAIATRQNKAIKTTTTR